MHGIYELKEMLCKELENYGEKGELSAGTLDIVDKLAHTIKNLDKIIEADEGYSNYGGSMSYRGGSYDGGGSYARGRGGNARRDSRGRYSNENSSRAYSRDGYSRENYSRDGYSRTGDMVEQLREMMGEAPDDKTRQEIQRLVTKLEQM